MKVVDQQPQPQLYQEQRAQSPGVARGEAVMLVDGAAAAAEGDDGDEEPQEDQEHGHGDDGVVQEVKVLPVRRLDHHPGHDDDAAHDLKIRMILFFITFALIKFSTLKWMIECQYLCKYQSRIRCCTCEIEI